MVDPDLAERIRAARRRLAENGPTTSRGHGDFERVALPYEDGDVLRDILRREQVGIVVEIGLAYGASALAIAEALASSGGDDTRHVIIDPFQDHFDDAGWNAIVSVGAGERCTLLRERSQLVLPRLVGEGFVADAAFVDGSHIFHNVFVDLFFLGELLRPGGLVVLDDCQWASVATAVRYFELNTGWRPAPLRGQTRLRAYRLPETPIEPPFQAFRPFGAADEL